LDHGCNAHSVDGDPDGSVAIETSHFTATVGRFEAPVGPRGWHHHAEHHVVAYLIAGNVRIESDPNGSIVTESRPGDLVHIEPGTVHQETYEGDVAIVGFTIGSGPGRVEWPVQVNG
jgi:quercetin dioxygenase-like cupin family protein